MKKIFALTGLVCMLMMASCNGDGSDGGKNSSSTLKVTVSLDNMSKEAATRGSVDPEDGEEQVNTLYLYFFDASDSQSGMFVDYIKVEGPLAMDSKYTLQTAGTNIIVSNAYNIIAIANIDDNRYISGDADVWNTQWNGKTEEYFRANAFAGISGIANESDYSEVIDKKWILMNGATTKKAMSGDISMTLVRNVARFDVINSINTSYDLVSTSIWNAYTRSSITGDGVMDYSKTLGLRTERFYGVNNTDNTDSDILGNIMGGLYAFENKVMSPAPGDQHTSCLIIGLKNRTTNSIGYYRVNVHPSESAQNLKRNNVYKVTITGVAGEGAATESDAYAGTKNELEYAINYWDLDDNGLIISDQYSILAVPVKTVRIGAEGGDFSYTITTFSSLASPLPLAIKNQAYDPSNGKISASLNGATLTIQAQSLALGEGNRTGIITVSFAGLEAHINIVQSESVDTYLNVTLEDTWVSKLGSTAGLSSEYIYVKASGAWTAELFGDGFSLSNAGGSAVTTLSSMSLTSSKFHVYTHSLNDGLEERKAFVLVSLDSDPVNYIAVIPIYQKVAGAINISPDAETITFNGSKTITSHPANTTFTVSSTSGVINVFGLSGPDAGKFTVTLPTGSPSAMMTVAANELNTSGAIYTATLRIEDGTGAYKNITLRQNSLSLSVLPGTFSTSIVAAGGQTELITVSTGDASSQFTATVSTASSTSGKTLYNHAAYFVDESGNPIDLSIPQSVNTKFKVAFPKVYFPNREIGITATFTVNVVGSSLTRTLTVNQAMLRPANMVGYGMTGAPTYGGLGNTYNQGWDQALGNIPTYSRAGVGNMSASSISSNVTYLHVVPHGAGSGYNWSVVNNFIDSKDAWTVLCVQDNAGVAPANNSNSPLKRNGAGYNNIQDTGTADGRITTIHSHTKVYKFLFDYGNTALTAGQVSDFYSDGISTVLPSPWPSTAVVLATRNNNTDHAMLIIDVKNKFLWIGESQFFWYTNGNAYTDGNRYVFLNNLMHFVGNASRYGSHFTDLLLEDGQPGSMPAPWDDAWGANKWPENK